MSVPWPQDVPQPLYRRILGDVIAKGIEAAQDTVSRETRYSGMRLRQFIEEVLGEELWSKQRDICDALDDHRYVAVRSCHAAGKSFIAARIALAYLHTRPNSIVITTAPTNRQVKNVLWRYINAVAAKHGDNLLGRCLQMEYQIAPDWYALGFKGSNENSDAFQGFHSENILLIVDEAAGVPEVVFEAADAILTGAGAACLLIGNPTSTSGTFRDAFHRDRDLWHGIKISAYDTPNFTGEGNYPALIDADWVERQKRRHGEDSAFMVSRIDAEFPVDAGDTLIPLVDLEGCANQVGELEAAPGTMYEAGLDVARFGDDESSLVLRRGPEYHGQWSWGKLDTMETTGRAIHHLTEAGLTKDDVEIKVDATGIGSGVADRLRELGWNAVDVHFGAKSSDSEKWPILRHELWWQLRERVRDRRIAPVEGVQLDEVAIAQASDVKIKYNSTHSMPLIETKDEAKRRGVSSPDRAEAWVLAFGQLPPEEEGPLAIISSGGVKGRW